MPQRYPGLQMPQHGGRPPRGNGESPHRAHYKSNAWKQVARRVVQAADVCALCGRPPTPTDPLEADHIVPLALGGASTPDNLRATHKSCNSRRGAQFGNTWRKGKGVKTL